MSAKLLDRHSFVFNPKDNGGESVFLVTEIYDNGDAAAGLPGGIFTNQRFVLQSYCNSAELQLVGASLTPESLRQLANELDEFIVKTKAEIKEKVKDGHQTA